jgi:hypothetical protein
VRNGTIPYSYPKAIVTHEECRHILGTNPDTSPEEVRQAYLDLVRVWHPDRFQAEPRLLQRAEETLRQINCAYTTLKNASPEELDAERAPSFTAAESAPPPPQPAPPVVKRRRRDWLAPLRRWRFHLRLPFRLPYALGVVALVALPTLAVTRLVPLLRVSGLPPEISVNFQPRILAPMRVIDASKTARDAAETLTEWAKGDSVDLWKPAVPVPTSPVRTFPVSVPVAPQRAAAAGFKPPEIPGREVQAPPASGTELIPTLRRPGVGSLSLTNRTELAAIVRLVSGRSTTVRAVYVAPHATATLRAIGIGVYDVHVDLGSELDLDQLRFAADQFSPSPVGPLEFLEITSERGVQGNHYELALNPR